MKKTGRRLMQKLAAAIAAASLVVMIAPTAAVAAATPSFTTSVTAVADTRVDIAITGTGYGDVKALPGQSEPHVYFTLIERGSDLATVDTADTAISAEVTKNGTISDTLSVPAAELSEKKSYELISWPSRSFPSETNLYARANVDIDWSSLFPGRVTPTPTATPKPTATAKPTAQPTAQPTAKPTATPKPTAQPTAKPTAKPTTEPTAEPTTRPTAEPTNEPAEPTEEPTVEPSAEPTTEPDPAPADPGEAPTIERGTLVWGISAAWRRYITGPIANGEFLAVEPAQLNDDKSVTWVNGSGDVDLDAGSGTIEYEGGLTARGHNGLGPDGGWALNQTFSNVRIELTSTTSATMSAEVTQPLTDYAPEYTGQRVEIAALTFADGDLQDGLVTASAVFTDDGADIYSRMNEDFQPGAAVDDVIFGIGVEAPEPAAPASTTVELSATPESATAGDAVALTASIAPAAEGTVTFWDGSVQIGDEVAAESGSASAETTELTAGSHRLTARFAPAAEGERTVTSNEVTVTIVADEPAEAPSTGSLEWGVKESFRTYVVGSIAHGEITVDDGASQAPDNGVFTYPQASGGTEWNADAATGTVQYAGSVTFTGHGGVLNHTISNPAIRVVDDASAQLTAVFRGETIAFADIDLGSGVAQDLEGGALRVSGARATLTDEGAEFFSYGDSHFYEPGTELDRITFTVGAASDVPPADPPAENEQPAEEQPAATPDDEEQPAPTADGASAGALTWGVSSAFVAYTTCENKESFGYSHCAGGSITTSGVGDGYRFPQASGGDWNAETQTGTVAYSGVVTFNGYGMALFSVANPSITVSGPSEATLHTGNTSNFGAASYPLDLSGASKTVGENGEVTWSGVRVSGSLSGGPGGDTSNSIGFDNLSFTVGSASTESFGSTERGGEPAAASAYEAAETAPTTDGLEILTSADDIREEGRIRATASGFDAGDEGILVVLYNGDGAEPVVIDDTATADDEGVVTWAGTLPEGATGEHVLTVQGSDVAGAAIDILEKSDEQVAAPVAVAQADPPVAAAPAPATPVLVVTGGLSTVEWWVIAGGLAAIALCMILLASRRPRAAAA